ncbi:conserved hypothetical protein [Histoplasma capsulatum var. duboisii H88]|uniref:Eukaryotic initiation factor 1A n=2 Tax=Ajellomyces capsulatus TaxID=5037 RepID=F0UE26_AJEC8|nr:conserved hypothetical protein [Histoplasma capsulatum H143]EGC44556.1 conserved hypothetical protein [Histoplasma capsulatum var. duboisii H88]QSS55331.1 eukaryotic initiation factor 1A [Histoplasma capsulatum var. duboisii H88]
MAPPRRKLLATVEETLVAPDSLLESHKIAKVIKATGNNVYAVELPSKETVLVELAARFRSTIWVKRGTYVLVDMAALEDRGNKLSGEIINIVRNEKEWRKAHFWPKEFAKPSREEDDDEDSISGKLPPSEDEDE